jgi:hypothetical protein
MGVAERTAYLVRRGYQAQVAQTIARFHDKLLALRRPLRVREVTFDYDVDSGVSIELELCDFVVAFGERAPAAKTPVKERRRERVVDGRGVPIGDPLEGAA